MSLDFNTPEPKMGNQANNSKNKLRVGNCSIILLLLALGLGISLVSLFVSIQTIKNNIESPPISIECDPDLLKKIENEVSILEEISGK